MWNQEEALMCSHCWPLQSNTFLVVPLPLQKREALQSGHCWIWGTTLNLEKAVILTAKWQKPDNFKFSLTALGYISSRQSQSCQWHSWKWPACQKNHQEVLPIRSYRGLKLSSTFDLRVKIFLSFLNIFKSQTWKCIWWLFTSLHEIKGCVVM